MIRYEVAIRMIPAAGGIFIERKSRLSHSGIHLSPGYNERTIAAVARVVQCTDAVVDAGLHPGIMSGDWILVSPKAGRRLEISRQDGTSVEWWLIRPIDVVAILRGVPEEELREYEDPRAGVPREILEKPIEAQRIDEATPEAAR